MTIITELFDKLAVTTWDTIGNAYENRISYGEDAITSVNLLALKNTSFPNLAIADTRSDESTKGCDFEFWIGSHKKGWFRYAIQAKKITVSSERYSSLNHKVAGRPQIDILEKYALANKAIPLYCLFNFSENSTVSSSSCPKFRDIREFGCSVTPSSTAKLSIATRGTRNFDWFHNRHETLPWSCLVRCPKLYEHWTEKKLGIKYKSAIHKELPLELTNLLYQELDEETLLESEIFSKETPYRPKWVGVVNNLDEETFG